VSVRNVIKIGQTLQRYGDLIVFFIKMAAVRRVGFVGRILGQKDQYMVVSIVAQNFVEIDAICSIT